LFQSDCGNAKQRKTFSSQSISEQKIANKFARFTNPLQSIVPSSLLYHHLRFSDDGFFAVTGTWQGLVR